MAFTDLIVTHDNVISPELCEEIISRFEDDDRKYEGITGGMDGVDLKTKISTDLTISCLPEWADVDGKLFEAVTKYFTEYLQHYSEVVGMQPYGFYFHDMGYQIQKTKPGEFYKWHHDYVASHIQGFDHGANDTDRYLVRDRLFTYILYLNDRDDEWTDGRTQFTHCGEITSIIPKAGRLLLFPANEIYTHRGETLETGVKYLMTGWAGHMSSCSYSGVNEPESEACADFVHHFTEH
jgi:hypothetical protein